MLSASLTLSAPRCIPKTLSLMGSALCQERAASLRRGLRGATAQQCWRSPSVSQRAKHRVYSSFTVSTQHLHYVHVFAICKAGVCGQKCIVVPGISPLPEPLLHLPGPAGSHPTLLTPAVPLCLPWSSSSPCTGGCLCASSAPLLLGERRS